MSIHRQRGNVLFLILIAVVLFAALSWAISRSNQGIAESQNEKLDTEYGKYASILNLATSEFTRLMVQGCALSDVPQLSTDSASANPKCNFYGSQGGHFSFTIDGQIPFQLNKISIPTIGTNADDAVAVITMTNSSANHAVCDRVNYKNDITYTQTMAETFWSANVKNFSDADGATPGAWPVAFASHSQGCVFDVTAGKFYIYSVVSDR